MKPKIALFALTGMGNEILDALISSGNSPKVLITREENSVYPYYDEVNIDHLAKRSGIPVEYDVKSRIHNEALDIDMIIVGTYHHILDKTLIDKVNLGINFHPSLLPKYAGRNPYSAVIFNREKKTGLTVHKLSPKIDEGPIYLQEKLILKEDVTQSLLRKKIAKLAGDLTNKLMYMLEKDLLVPINKINKPKNIVNDISYRTINLDNSSEYFELQVKAFLPYPGLIVNNNILPITKVEKTEIGCFKESCFNQINDRLYVLTLKNKKFYLSCN
jgi:methionyl-tRNA formyltransferase